jgi:Zn-dependent M32 family carboxypeptidase
MKRRKPDINMNSGSHDPRDIPILTNAVEQTVVIMPVFDTTALHAAILTETLQLADSLLHQAAKDIEAILFERVFDRLRAQLPELVDRILREHAAPKDTTEDHG